MLFGLIFSAFVAFSKGQIVAPPPPALVNFGTTTYGGSGCKQGTVGVNFNPDRSAFTIIFDKYTASIGPQISFLDNRRDCSLNMVVNVPSGHQYSVTTVNYYGSAKLSTLVTATQNSTYYFQGKTFQSKVSKVFRGPMKSRYAYSETFPIETLNYSPCKQNTNLNIKVETVLASTSSTATGWMTNGSIEGTANVTFYQTYGIKWKQC